MNPPNAQIIPTELLEVQACPVLRIAQNKAWTSCILRKHATSLYKSRQEVLSSHSSGASADYRMEEGRPFSKVSYKALETTLERISFSYLMLCVWEKKI